MTVYLLDSNILSDMLRNPRGKAAEEYRRLSRDIQARLATSIVVASEMRYGAAKKGSQVLSDRVGQLLNSMEILPLTQGVDAQYGELRADLERRGELIGSNDMFLAAHALTLDAVLVTDNTREFERVKGLRLENWIR